MDALAPPEPTRPVDPWLVRREVTVEIGRDAEAVHALVSDVTRIGEWSPECHAAAWLTDQRGVGAQFKGDNRWGRNRWSRTCEVVEDRPGREFGFRTVPGFGPSADSSIWRFSVEPTAEGCVLTQSLQPVKPPQRWFRPFIRRFMPHHLDMREQMSATLEAIRATAEADAVDRSRPQ
jgi:hypothetical protein